MSIHPYKLKGGKTGYKAVVQVSPTEQKSKKFGRKADAEVWEREMKRLKELSPHLLKTSAMSLTDLAATWMESYGKLHLQVSTQRRYERDLKHILPVFGHVRLSELRQRAVETWLLRLRDESGLAPKTCNGCLGLFRKLLNDAVRWGYLAANPIHGARGLKSQDQGFAFWTMEEAKAFLDYVAAFDPESYPVFFLTLSTGMRLGEVAALQWDCVDLERHQITVKRSWCQTTKAVKEATKTSKARIVPVNSSLRALLKNLRRSGSDDDFVLARLDFKNLNRRVKALAALAGVKPINFHDLRHSFASMWMASGQSMFELQKVLGHQSIQQTERYSHLAPGHLSGKTDFLALGGQLQTEIIARELSSSAGTPPQCAV